MNILTAPNSGLKEISNRVTSQEYEEISKLIPNMYQLMKQKNGIGLAAPQVGITKRFLIIEIEGETNGLLVMINPVITETYGGTVKNYEGCLSLPGGRAPVERADKIRVVYWDENQKQHELHADGLLSRCIQHEIDHLDGILYIDKVNNYHRTRVMDQVRKITKR